MWCLYVILCQDNSLYTGITNNLDKRFLDHQRGLGGRYTRAKKVLRIVYQEKLNSKSEALKREIEIKRWRRDLKIKNLKLDLV